MTGYDVIRQWGSGNLPRSAEGRIERTALSSASIGLRLFQSLTNGAGFRLTLCL